MSVRRIAILIIALCTVTLFNTTTFAQGGWRQWDIYLVDGSKVQANPLGMNANGQFTQSMDKSETGLDRSKISYIAAVTQALPHLPSGPFDSDMIVFLDGKRSFGAVTFRELKFSEGIIMQNGKKISLEKVAYIRFIHSRRKKTNRKT